MSFDEGLAQRVREVLDSRPGVAERKMFGGPAFLLDGKMFVGISGSKLMARVGTARYQDALALPHVRQMDFTGKPLKGYVYVEPQALAEDSALAAWVALVCQPCGWPAGKGVKVRRSFIERWSQRPLCALRAAAHAER